MGLSDLHAQPPDPLLAVMEAFRADTRPEKIDLGVGVYRTERGETPVMRAVKAAEARLVETEISKAYLGASGDLGFLDLAKALVFGDGLADRVVAGLQATGGTGALRLAADLLARAGVHTIHVGRPCWANHLPLLKAAGLRIQEHAHFDPRRQIIDFASVHAALERAKLGEAVLLQATCHNPTGADFTIDQWRALADIVSRQGLIALIDVAYQGLGEGLEADMVGARLVAESAPEALVAVSCSKTFGLYRERTGALFALSEKRAAGGAIQSHLQALARANYSMPPNHGAAVVRVVLESPGLKAAWAAELAGIRSRISELRQQLGAFGWIGRFDVSGLSAQRGMFALLPLTPAEIRTLGDQHAVYVAPDGRMNLAGLQHDDVARFAGVLESLKEPT